MRCARILVCCGLLLGPARPALGADPPRPLRVVTYNMLHGGFGLRGDGQHLEERLAMATDVLRGLDVDLIGLQEASSGRRRGDVAGRLATALGLHHVRAPAGYRWVGRLASWVMGFDEGPAVLRDLRREEPLGLVRPREDDRIVGRWRAEPVIPQLHVAVDRLEHRRTVGHPALQVRVQLPHVVLDLAPSRDVFGNAGDSLAGRAAPPTHAVGVLRKKSWTKNSAGSSPRRSWRKTSSS